MKYTLYLTMAKPANILLYVVLLFASTAATAQKKNLDSLVSLLKTTTQDSILVKTYLDLGNYFQNNNPDTAIYFHTRALESAKKIPADDGELLQGEAKRGLGWDFYVKCKYQQALKQYNEALNTAIKYKNSPDKKISAKAQKLQANCFGNMGVLYKVQGDYPNALDYYFKAEKIYEETGNKRSQAINLGNIGVVYYNQSNYSKALEYYFKALKMNDETGNKKGQAYNLGNIGGVYYDKGNYSSALSYYFKALKITEEIGDKNGQALNLGNIGITYNNQGDYSKALEYDFKALKIFQEIGDERGQAINLGAIGKVYTEQGQYSKAENYLKKAESLNRLLRNTYNLKGNCDGFSKLYEKTGKYQLALKYYKEYISLRDSLQSEENYKAALQNEMQYNYEKQAALDSIANAKEMKIKEAAIAQQQAELKVKRNQQYALYGGLALVIVFGVFMFNRYRVTKKQKLIIEEQKAEVDTQKAEAEKQRDAISKQKEIIEEAHKEITDSIRYAKRIQSAILPPEKLVKELLPESFILYLPKDVVAGDFYWVERQNDIVFIAACDCTGHGVPGAMVSVVCNNGLNRAVREYNLVEPGKILDKTREIVIAEFEKSEEEVKDGMDVSLCALDIKNQQLYWAGANNPLWMIHNNAIEVTVPDKQPIGKTDNPAAFTTHSMPLQKGSTIYIFTDGYQDQFGGEKGKKFKAARLKDFLLSVQHESMARQKEMLLDNFLQWKNELEQVDDVCIIGIRL